MCTTFMHRWKQGKAILLETQVFKILLALINFININKFHFFIGNIRLLLIFDEHSTRQQIKHQKWRFDYCVSFPNWRQGEAIAKEVEVKQDYSCRCKLTNFKAEFCRLLPSQPHFLFTDYINEHLTFWRAHFQREVIIFFICRGAWCQRSRQSAKTSFNSPSGTKNLKKRCCSISWIEPDLPIKYIKNMTLV